MATNSFLKVTTVTSATLALVASTATAAYAEETVTPAPAETTAATSTDATVAPEVTAEATPAESTEAPAETAEAPASTDEGKLNSWYQPGDFVRTGDGLFVMTSMGVEMGSDGLISGASGFENYDLNKIFVELFDRNDGLVAAKANVHEALGVPFNDETQFFNGNGAWGTSNPEILTVDRNGVLTALADGDVTITFNPAFIENNTVVYRGLSYTINLTVKDGVISVAEETPADPAPPVEPEPTPVIPEPTPAPVEPEPAPLDPAPVDPTPAPDSAPVDPAPAPEQPAPPVADPTDPAAPFVYENCAAVYEAGAAPIREGDHGWHKSLDADGDGVGCEVKPDYTNEKDAGKKEAAQKQKSDAASKTGNQQLAKTGADGVAPLMGGLALVATGASAVAVSRRRTK